MIVGVPKEVKPEEYRVALTPDGARALISCSAKVLVEASAGAGSGFTDDDYRNSGAEITDRLSVFSRADLIVKVKEPFGDECDLLRPGQTVFTYLHLAPNRPLTERLLARRVTALAYETLEVDGGLPLLAPMSAIAGRMAPLVGAFYLQKFRGGTGVLPTGVPGVPPAKIVVLGAGVVGVNCVRVAAGIGMKTVVLNRNVERLRQIDEQWAGRIVTLPLTEAAVRREIVDADIVVGAVLVPGGRTPVLISRPMLATMKKGAVILDVSVDQGGCAETSRPSSHDDPIYTVDGVLHYTVANMPGAYPHTSTIALTNATLPYMRMIANKGVAAALAADAALRSALNLQDGEIRHRALAEAFSGS